MDEPSQSSGHTRLRWAWPAFYASVAAFALFLQGQVGRITTWMDGDMQYHRGVSLTISRSHLLGEGPYEGLPSYLTGLYHYSLAAASRLGIWPDTLISVTSWIEPLAWLLAAYFLASQLWQRRPIRAAFVVMVLFAAGPGSGPTRSWIDGVTLAGHVYWPIFPRDVAITLMLVAIGVALADRPIVAGIIAGIAIGVHPQIGAIAVLWSAIAIALGQRRPRYRYALTAIAIAALVSAWYWLPRVFLAARLGGLQFEDFRTPLTITPLNLWLGFGLLLPIATVGAVLGLRDRRRATILAVVWSVALIVPVLLASFVDTGLLTTRRALLLLSLPVVVLVTELFSWILERNTTRRGQMLVVGLLLMVLALGVPFHRSTRSLLDRKWTGDRYAVLEYPSESWRPLLVEAANRSKDSTVLVAERDAPVLWYLTGARVPWMKRPGFVKTGFDVGAATGWSEEDRETEATAAFTGGRGALCDLMTDRAMETALLRSDQDLLGTYDLIPAAAYRDRADPRYSDENKHDTLEIRPYVPFVLEPPPGTVRIDVWFISIGNTPRMGLDAGAGLVQPTQEVPDGRSTRASFVVGPTAGTVRFGFDQSVLLLRVVAYEPFAGVDAPAAVLDRTEICASAGR